MTSLRVDLCDIYDPDRLAQAVLDLLRPDVGRAVPVTEIALALDIAEVRCAPLKGCEGLLLTDRVRSEGSILANNAHCHAARTRFTIAHELGHFLLEHHEPLERNEFRCSAGDMGIQGGTDRYARQEAEANRFAIGLLAPAARYAYLLTQPPDLGRTLDLGATLEISREAALRRLVALHPERLAVVFCRDGVIRVAPRGPTFPWLKAIKNHDLPVRLELPDAPGAALSAWHEADAGTWCDPQAGSILQQVHVSAAGFVTILLHQPGVASQMCLPVRSFRAK